MVKPSRDGLLKQRKALQLALRELGSGVFRATTGRMYRLSAQNSGHPLDTPEDRIASVERRIAQIDDQIKRGDHA